MKLLGILLLVFMTKAIDCGRSREPDFVLAFQNMLISWVSTPYQTGELAPDGPLYCIRCVAGDFLKYEGLLTHPAEYSFITWREEWKKLDCLMHVVTHELCNGPCVTVTVSEQLKHGFQAKGLLMDCSDDIFNGTDVGSTDRKNSSHRVERHFHRLDYDFTYFGNNNTQLARYETKRILHRYFYERMQPETIYIYIAVAFLFPLVCCCVFCCWFKICCNERARRRKYKRQKLEQLALHPITIELENRELEKSNAANSEQIVKDEDVNQDVENGDVGQMAPDAHLFVENFIDDEMSARGEDAILEDKVEAVEKKVDKHKKAYSEHEVPDNKDSA